MTTYQIKRIYEPVARGDGYRILVDRLWPRGVSKHVAVLDQWLKNVAPSNKLRRWFGHDPKRFEEFKKRYVTELDDGHAAELLRSSVVNQSVVTLLYGAHDEIHNQAVVLRDYLER